MLDKLHTILYTDCHLSPKSVIVVGVSGGPDSLCLLHILLAAGFQVVPAHYNHKLRPQSAEDARFVERFTARYGLSCKIGSGDVAAFSRQSGCSIEEAGRILRYRFLFEQAALVGAKAVAVGHQADDQVETVLLHILRGSGLTGLNGMAYWQLPNPWSQEIPLVRPLLSVWREEILAYCDQHNLSPVEDASNQDVGFVRNRLRHELIPALETFNPRIRQAVWRMSRSVQADVQVLDELTQAAWSECLAQSGDGAVSLWHDRLLRQPVALQRRLLRRAISELRQVSRSLSTGTQDVDFEMIELGLSAMRQVPKTRQIDLGLGLRLIFEPNLVWVAAWESHLPKGDWPSVSPGSAALPLSVPGCLPLGDGWQLTTLQVSAADSWPQFQVHMDPYQAWLDISNFSGALVVRSRLPGDRFHPLGLEGHSLKLSDFMINMKLPARARSHWPLVCAGEQIVWVPGYAVSHLARLQPGSHVVVQLKLERTAQPSS
jgi:tRNA(Ile)-lysidine synthase